MKILVLAGTSEARALTRLLSKLGHEVTASLAGVTKHPHQFDVPLRREGFKDSAALDHYIKAHDISCLIDATHPFATEITRHAALSQVAHMAFLRRPAWRAGPKDQWKQVKDLREASQYIERDERVFLALGKKAGADLSCLSHAYAIARMIEPIETPYPYRGEYLHIAPPYDVESERDLIKAFKPDWMIVKNAGGKASWPKLEAARHLGLPVLMIARPPPPKGLIFETPEEVSAWIETL